MHKKALIMKLLFPILFSLFILSSMALASNPDTLIVADSTKNKLIVQQKKEQPPLVLNLELIDFPYQLDASKTVNNGNVTFSSFLKGYANPSMQQSLQLTTSLYSGLHYGIDKLFKTESYAEWSKSKRFWHNMTILASDYLLITAPGFDGWLHEEYHRSVMTRFGVNSYNDMNKFPIGAETVSVSHVTDEDLIRFKQQSSSDFIRMHVAGIEGEYLLAEQLQKNNFFYNQNASHQFAYILNILNAIVYVNISSNSLFADEMTDQMNARETTTPVRDFTGLDFTGWTYDLFRPNEPYTSRGTHPSGLGIDRYIKVSDLNNDELNYLKKQGSLQWLNLLSPMIFGFKDIKLNENGLYGNFAIRNYLTSFGNDISANIFLKSKNYNYAFTLHNYNNYEHYFPAFEMELVDFIQPIGQHLLYVTPRAILGLQPFEQNFTTNKSAFLGLLECKIEYKTRSNLNPYIELSAKSKGWIAGNEFLSSNLSARLGLSMRIYK